LYCADTPEFLQSVQMDKVLSAIKSLECVDILQGNVKEDTEVVQHSGHGSASGSGSVENEENN